MRLNSKLVLIKPDQPVEEQDGIYIAEEWKDLPPTGVVVGVASDVTFCDIGDKVFFERYSAIETPEDYRIVREDAVLGVYDA
jgi:co-chaperonin GroES (HSP10)